MKRYLAFIAAIGFAGSVAGTVPGDTMRDTVAVEVAMAELVSKFGQEQVDAQRPYQVSHRPGSNSWFIRGTPSPPAVTMDYVLAAMVHQSRDGLKAWAFARKRTEANNSPEPKLTAVTPAAKPADAPATRSVH